MSAGFKSVFDQTFLTDRVLYRTVTSADSSPNGLPVINLHVNMQSARRIETGTFQPYGQPADVDYTPACRGYNANVALYLALTGTSKTAAVTIWAWGGADPLPAPSVGLTDQWYKVQSYTITAASGTERELLMLRSIPATPVVVTVDSITSGGTLTIVEQHTE